MRTVGYLKDHREIINTIITPIDIKSFNNEVNFLIQSGSGEKYGYEDLDYETEGAFIKKNPLDIINLADIIIIHNEINDFLPFSHPKTFLTDINYLDNYIPLMSLLGLPVNLYSFSDENLKKCHVTNNRSFKSYYLGFLQYNLGEPIDSNFITTLSQAKVINQGKIVNNQLLDEINSF